jgi:Fe2+ or Zn2+ uptake regulation protein
MLRGAGLRVTRPRVAVLGVLAHARRRHEHLSAGQVAVRAREMLGSLSTQAVYDCLDALTAAGLLRRIEPAGSPARFEARVGDNHHHLVCRRCGAVSDVSCAVGTAPCLTPSDTSGFSVEEAEVVFWGSCPSCSGTDVPTDAPTTPTTRPTSGKELQVR